MFDDDPVNKRIGDARAPIPNALSLGRVRTARHTSQKAESHVARGVGRLADNDFSLASLQVLDDLVLDMLRVDKRGPSRTVRGGQECRIAQTTVKFIAR